MMNTVVLCVPFAAANPSFPCRKSPKFPYVVPYSLKSVIITKPRNPAILPGLRCRVHAEMRFDIPTDEGSDMYVDLLAKAYAIHL